MAPPPHHFAVTSLTYGTYCFTGITFRPTAARIATLNNRRGMSHLSGSQTLDLYGHVLPHMQEGAAMLRDQEFAKALREHERNKG